MTYSYYRNGTLVEAAMASDPVIDEDHTHAVDPTSVQHALEAAGLGAIASLECYPAEVQPAPVVLETRQA